MITPSWFLLGALLPAAVTAAALGALGWPIAGTRPALTRALIWPLALLSGFLVGWHATMGWPIVPPTESQHWLAWLFTPLAAGVAAAFGFLRPTSKLRWIALILLAGLTVPTLLLSYLRYTWAAPEAVCWVSALALAIALFSALLDHTQNLSPPRWLSAYLAVLAAATALMLFYSGTEKLGKLALSVAAVLGAAHLVSWFLNNESARPSSWLAAWIPLAGLWIDGHFYASLTPTNTLLLAGAIPLAWLLWLVPLGPKKGWKSALIRFVIASIPPAIALTQAAIAFNQKMSQQPW